MEKESASYRNFFGIELYEGRLQSHKFPWHYHFNYTLIIVDEGEMVYRFRDAEVLVRQGTAFIINPLDTHYNLPGEAGCAYKAIFLTAAIFSAADDALVFFSREHIADTVFVEKLREYFREIQGLESTAAKDRLLAAFREFLLAFIVHSTGRIAYEPRIFPALEYINAHLEEKLLISPLARLCFMSPFHFQRVFKQSVGLTLKAYIQQQKTELAKQRLNARQSIGDTVYETGYFDHGHFNKAFKKMWVVNPSHFT